MPVQVPFGMRLAVGRALMKTHGVGKRNLKEVVVPSGQTLECICQSIFLISRKFTERPDVPTGDYQSFKRPDGPERHQDGEVLVLKDDPLAPLFFQRQVVAKQA